MIESLHFYYNLIEPNSRAATPLESSRYIPIPFSEVSRKWITYEKIEMINLIYLHSLCTYRTEPFIYCYLMIFRLQITYLFRKVFTINVTICICSLSLTDNQWHSVTDCATQRTRPARFSYHPRYMIPVSEMHCTSRPSMPTWIQVYHRPRDVIPCHFHVNHFGSNKQS